MDNTQLSVPQPVRQFKKDALNVEIFESQPAMALNAAHTVRNYLIGQLEANGSVRAILATGNSQIQFLKTLIDLGGVDWSRVTLFHMDEYLGISETHKASFRLYMKERVESLVKPQNFHYLDRKSVV